jgi:hypothetical protein
MIQVVHPRSGSWFFTHPGSQIQGSKGHRIPEHCYQEHGHTVTTTKLQLQQHDSLINPNHISSLQCCGTGSESGSLGSICFWATWIRIRILLSSSKNNKKKFDSYCFISSFYLKVRENPDPNPDPLVRGIDPPKISWIRNTGSLSQPQLMRGGHSENKRTVQQPRL